MSSYVPDTHDHRQTRDALHASRRLNRNLIEALQSARAEFIARHGSESQFAAACGLSLNRLHELIGKHEDFSRLRQEGWRA